MLDLLLWVVAIIAGFGMAVFASQKAVAHATTLAYGLGVPPFLIGLTIMSIGTDVPEIANSVVSSISGHGDLNVGDSIGSVATQMTLVMGLLPFVTGAFPIVRKRILLVSLLTVAALLMGAWLMDDGFLSRVDALWLFTAWIVSTGISVKYAPPLSEAVLKTEVKRKMNHALVLIGSLILVGIGAGTAVKGIVELAAVAEIPEYFISFFGASIGTSLPELFVDITALRAGKRDIAVGDVVGSCMVDATLSISAGPLIAPTLVTAALAVKGSVLAAIAMFAAAFVLAMRRKHDRWSGAFLLLLYAGVYYFLIKGD